MKVFAIIFSVALIASVSAQNDMFSTMMLMRMLGGGSSGGASAGASSGASGSSGASSLFGMGGRGGFNPAMLALGGDRMRDMMMCNMYPRQMRTLCMARVFQ